MNLTFNTSTLHNYQSGSQKARVLTEGWLEENMFCPRCGAIHIKKFPNNKPVADFFCLQCKSEFELKSKSGSIKNKVNDGAYNTMISRITSNNNPDFFFMNYSKSNLQVKDILFIPKHFFTPSIIEKRKPLIDTARRAGWTGCNILIKEIPEQGKIPIILNGVEQDIEYIIRQVKMSDGLIQKDISDRGWLFDILNIVNKLSTVFSLSDIYAFEEFLFSKHLKNHNIKAKIRQQLQILRDKGFLEFLGKGVYRKIEV